MLKEKFVLWTSPIKNGGRHLTLLFIEKTDKGVNWQTIDGKRIKTIKGKQREKIVEAFFFILQKIFWISLVYSSKVGDYKRLLVETFYKMTIHNTIERKL